MKINKLNARGFSHDLLLVGVIVLTAIIGVGYIVASHAETCSPVSGPVSEISSGVVSSSASGAVSGDVELCAATSGPVTAPASSPETVTDNSDNPTTDEGNSSTDSSADTTENSTTSTSAPDNTGSSTSSTSAPSQTTTKTSTPKSSASTHTTTTPKTTSTTPSTSTITPVVLATKTVAGSCKLGGIPSNPRYRQVLKPSLAITNRGTQSFRPFIEIDFSSVDSQGQAATVISKQVLQVLPAQQSYSEFLATYKIPFSSATATKVTYKVIGSGDAKFSCSAQATLPAPSLWAKFIGLFH